MADTLKNEFSDLNDVEIVPGNRGEFTVWLGETLLAKKTYNGFPEPQAVIDAMRDALKS